MPNSQGQGSEDFLYGAVMDHTPFIEGSGYWEDMVLGVNSESITSPG